MPMAMNPKTTPVTSRPTIASATLSGGIGTGWTALTNIKSTMAHTRPRPTAAHHLRNATAPTIGPTHMMGSMRETMRIATMPAKKSIGALLHRRGALHVARTAFGENSQASRDFLIGLFDVAEVTAETVLVQLLTGLGVPKPAIIRADLIGEDQAHFLVLIEPAVFQLEVDQTQADAEEETEQEIVDPERHRQDLVDVLGC